MHAVSSLSGQPVRDLGTQFGYLGETTKTETSRRRMSEEDAGQDKRWASQKFVSLGKRCTFSPIPRVEHFSWLANQGQVADGVRVVRYPVTHRG
jgi:hypothetical protein